ncbi:uncharacterized protein LOC141848879 isoform X2 [Brevipalpus obovatus]
MSSSSAKDRISVRIARNESERQRRDRINGLITRLNDLLSTTIGVNRKLDKISTLRLAAAFLRWKKNPTLTLTKERLWSPESLDADRLQNCIEAIDGIIFITNGAGKLMYVSEKCLQYLGYQCIDMIGYDLSHFIHPCEKEGFQSWIEKAKSDLIHNDKSISERLIYRCRMKERNQPRSETSIYQMVQISGFLAIRQEDRSIQSKRMRLIRAKNGHTSAKIELLDTESSNNNNSNNDTKAIGPVDQQDIIFKGVIELCKTNPMSELNLMEANLDEYILRMTPDGVILYADHRIHLITGFSPSEVEGRSAYEFVVPEDHGISFFAHRNMLVNASGTGIIVHRLRTVSGKLIYLQSAGCLQYDSVTGEVDHFVAVIRLMMEHEGDREREKFVRKFTPHISNTSPAALYQSLQVVIGPKKSEVTYQSFLTSENNLNSSGYQNKSHDENCRDQENRFCEKERTSSEDKSITLPSRSSGNGVMIYPEIEYRKDHDQNLRTSSNCVNKIHNFNSNPPQDGLQQVVTNTNIPPSSTSSCQDADDDPQVLAEIRRTPRVAPYSLISDQIPSYSSSHSNSNDINGGNWQNFSPYSLLQELQKCSSSARYSNRPPNNVIDSQPPNAPLTINIRSLVQENRQNEIPTGAFVIHASRSSEPRAQPSTQCVTSTLGSHLNSVHPMIMTTNASIPGVLLNQLVLSPVTLNTQANSVPTIAFLPQLQPVSGSLLSFSQPLAQSQNNFQSQLNVNGQQIHQPSCPQQQPPTIFHQSQISNDVSLNNNNNSNENNNISSLPQSNQSEIYLGEYSAYSNPANYTTLCSGQNLMVDPLNDPSLQYSQSNGFDTRTNSPGNCMDSSSILLSSAQSNDFSLPAPNPINRYDTTTTITTTSLCENNIYSKEPSNQPVINSNPLETMVYPSETVVPSSINNMNESFLDQNTTFTSHDNCSNVNNALGFEQDDFPINFSDCFADDTNMFFDELNSDLNSSDLPLLDFLNDFVAQSTPDQLCGRDNRKFPIQCSGQQQ